MPGLGKHTSVYGGKVKSKKKKKHLLTEGNSDDIKGWVGY